MNSSPERELEGHPARVQHARDHRDVLVLHVHALDGADALREDERARAPQNGGRVKKPRSFSHTIGGLRHSSIVVQMENTVANG